MSYTSRYDGPDLLPEERDVKAALSRCCTTVGATSRDWTPIAVVYQRYRTHVADKRFPIGHWHHDPDEPALLTRRQFGRAIRRVFNGIRRCKRAVSYRRKCWGYAGLAGDFSIVTRPPRRAAAKAAMSMSRILGRAGRAAIAIAGHRGEGQKKNRPVDLGPAIGGH